MTQTFHEFGISENLLKSLEEIGYQSPTEVQGKVIPRVLSGEDLIVISKTGSGKTGAFGIPMLEKLNHDSKGPKALILTPTRELAVQVDQDLKGMSKYKPIQTTVIYGGHSMVQEVDKLKKGVEIVTGTPGRVFDHISQGNLKTDAIEYLVLDEADRMLDMGFIDQVKRIIRKIPSNRVTMLFSATMPSEIQNLCKSYMKSPFTIEIESETKTVDSITQFYYKVEANEKRRQLHRILTVEQPESCMVFCNTRITVDRVNEFLENKGYTSKAIHGANSQTNRMKSIQQFKKGGFEVLVATDVAARGIHVDDLSLVINYDVPQDKDSYVHRIGRTGRAGHGGKAISLVTKDDLFTLYEIEEHVGTLIAEEPLPTDEQVNAMPKRTPKPRTKPAMHTDNENRNVGKSNQSRPADQNASRNLSRNTQRTNNTSNQNSTPNQNGTQKQPNTHKQNNGTQKQNYNPQRQNNNPHKQYNNVKSNSQYKKNDEAVITSKIENSKLESPKVESMANAIEKPTKAKTTFLQKVKQIFNRKK
ncbi:DEAD/DEAH box helicase [Fusibacter bizertensis]